MKDETMHVHLTYPPATRLSFWKRNWLSLWRTAFLFAGYTCLIVNFLTGGIAWSFLVVGGLMLFWIVFIYRPQVENTLIKKLCDVLIATCLYLLLVDSVLGTSWSGFVVPIVFFGDLIFIGMFFLLFFRKQKRNFLPLFELICAGIVATLIALVGMRTLNWPMIVVGSVSLGLLVLCMALFWQPMKVELQKKFHM